MNKKNEDGILQKILVIGPAVLVAGLLFFSGFFIGNDHGKNAVPSAFNGTVNADNNPDLTAFWQTWKLIDEKYIPASTTQQVSTKDKVYGAIAGMVDSLGDPYTVFLKPQENENFNENIKGNFTGVGMEVGMEDDLIVVISPLKNTPAEKAGIMAGDIIVELDGVSVYGLSLDEAVNKIRGEVGTTVVVTVVREGVNEPIEISIIRDVINIPTIDTESRPDGTFVISLYNFSANSSNDFRNALREFVDSKKSKLILDLRGNPGGYLDAAVDISSWFLPAGKVIVQEDFGKEEVKQLRSKGQNIFNDKLKMVILVNKGSASASEIVAGALQEYGIAKLVGTQTFGKGSVQELVPITPETSLKVTIARWLTPFGKSISDGGLTPDVVVDEAPEGMELYDYQLSEAVRILNEM